MKNLIVLILVIALSSCCGTKQVVKNAPKEQPKAIVQVINETTTTPEVIETPTIVDVETIETKAPNQVEENADINEAPDTIEVIEYETPIPVPEAFNHNSWNDLLKKHVSSAGNVDYKGIKKNRKTLTNYISSLGENMPNNTWSKEDKLAYWINAYNAMTVDLIIKNYPLKSIKDIKDPWEQRLWKLGEKWYNLDEIEHQILRKMNEPRIHFGIVCASYSCPKLQNEAFTASNLESQLTNATKEFLSDSKRNSISENSIELSKIFKWFKKDFEQSGSLIDFIDKYSNINVSSNAKISFGDYNWDLNE